MFRSLRVRNYRIWAAGAIVSNIGTWMQRTAQDWIVLTELTDHDAAAVGVVMALQFGPQVLLLPVTGSAADRFDRRTLLIATQATMGLLALLLGLLTVTGTVQLWHVYVFAFLLGCASAFDAPARQTFVSELVSGPDLVNAVGLNSTSFTTARLLGPAAAGVLIGVVGSGWVFLINAATFVAVLVSLAAIRVAELHRSARAPVGRGAFIEGLRYVAGRPDLRVLLLIMFLIGTFGMNFPIYLSTMTVSVFDEGAQAYGFLTSAMAVGSVIGALLAARRARPRMALLLNGSVVFAVGLTAAALTPQFLVFAALLVAVGVASQTLTTTATSTIQLGTDPGMRGRVVALMMAVTMGGTPIGGPLAGWMANAFGPQSAMLLGAAAGLLAAAVGFVHLARRDQLRAEYSGYRVHLRTAKRSDRTD